MRLLTQATSITAISVVGSALGFVVQLLLARQYGTGLDVDLYLFALSAPTFLAGAVVSFLSYGLVPRVASFPLLGMDQARFVSSGFHAVLLGAMAFLVLGLPVSAMLIRGLPADSAVASHPQLLLLLTIGWGLGAVQLVQGYWVAVLNAVRRHATAAWLALLPPAFAALLMGIGAHHAGIWIVGVGMLGGALCAVALALHVARQLLKAPRAAAAWRTVIGPLGTAAATVVALSCFASYSIVDAYWGPRAGNGTLATLGYAQRVLIAIGNLAIASPSAMLAPRLAGLLAQERFAKFKRELQLSLVVVGSACISLAAVLYLLADPVVHLLFKRGAFRDSDAQVVAETLRTLTPGMAAMMLSVVLFRILFCLPQATGWAAFIGASWTVAYFVGSSLLHRSGPTGIAQAYSCAWLGGVLLLGAYVFVRVKDMPTEDRHAISAVPTAVIESTK